MSVRPTTPAAIRLRGSRESNEADLNVVVARVWRLARDAKSAVDEGFVDGVARALHGGTR